MTTQVRERLIYKGEEFGITAFPFEPYLSRLDIKPLLVPPSTDCWRGYHGTWEIKRRKLYLINIVAFCEGDRQKGTDFFFRDQNEVFAWWFSGVIRIPRGKSSGITHYGYDPARKEDLLFEFKEGMLIRSRIADNRKE
jgi:hypothetical protein